jgi:hypothetical protein
LPQFFLWSPITYLYIGFFCDLKARGPRTESGEKSILDPPRVPGGCNVLALIFVSAFLHSCSLQMMLCQHSTSLRIFSTSFYNSSCFIHTCMAHDSPTLSRAALSFICIFCDSVIMQQESASPQRRYTFCAVSCCTVPLLSSSHATPA